MKSPFTVSIAIWLALTVPGAAHTRMSGHPTSHHWSVMAKATALAPSVVAYPLPPSRDIDGLSRHHDDCNMGCIDH
jgi:hypothetical protein